MLLSRVLIQMVIGTPQFFGLPCPVSHLQQWQCQNLTKGENTPYFPRYSGKHFIFFFLLRGISHLLWSVHFIPLKSCLPMYLPSFPWNTMQWEADENLTFYLLEREGGGNFTHPPTTPNHLKPPTMKKVNCLSKAWKCQIPSLTEWHNTVPVAIYH